MSRNASVTLDWADGTYRFRLSIMQLEELQEQCDAGPPIIMRRLAQDEWRVRDIRETIRLGLIGGGMKATDALQLVRRYVDNAPLAENLLTAQAVMAAAIVGVSDEQLKNSEGTEHAAQSHHSPTESSASPPSMAPPLSPESHQNLSVQ